MVQYEKDKKNIEKFYKDQMEIGIPLSVEAQFCLELKDEIEKLKEKDNT